jgi:hypothetical protein
MVETLKLRYGVKQVTCIQRWSFDEVRAYSLNHVSLQSTGTIDEASTDLIESVITWIPALPAYRAIVYALLV